MTRRLSLLLPLAILLAALAARIEAPRLVEGLELLVFDLYQRAAPRRYVPVPVKIIDIDDESLERIGQWPWPRSVLSRLVTRAFEGDPAVLALDFMFSEPDRTSPRNVVRTWPAGPETARIRADVARLPDYDAMFSEAIGRGRVVTGFVLTQRPTSNAPPKKWTLDVTGDDPRSFLPAFRGSIVNLPAIDAAAVGSGSFNVVPERDSVVRRIHLMYRLGDTIVPSLAAETLRAAQRQSGYRLRAAGGDARAVFGGYAGLNQIRIGDLSVPTDSNGRVWLHHTRFEPDRYLPAWRLLDPGFDVRTLQGNILLLGTSAAGLKDIRATPLDPVTAGVEIQAGLIEQILLGYFLERPGWADAAEILFTLILGVSLVLLLSVASALWCAGVGAGVVVLAVGISWYGFTAHRLLLDPIIPSLTALMIFLAASLTRFLESEADRRQVRSAFNHYLAPAVIDQLLADPGRLVLGGEKREMSFLFTDISGFTSLTEKMDPPVLVRLLNEYLDGTSAVILDHGGTIDKIVGDALHVMFNAPSLQPDHAARAVACAVELDRFCQRFARAQADREIRLGATRIGVNSGPCVIGNFGGTSRFDYTAHGDAINTAARLEGANKYLGTRICVSETTAGRCPDVVFRPVARLRLAGKAEVIRAFEPCGTTDETAADLATYTEAYELMDRAASAARVRFAELERRYPRDPLVRLHARRLAAGATGSEIVLSGK